MTNKYGVTSNFQDFTTYIRASSPSALSFAGAFSKGVMDQVVTITNIGELETIFGVPNKDNRVSFFLAQQCLITSNNLKVLRVPTIGSKNATADGTGLLIKNRKQYDDAYSEGQASVGSWVARTAGSWGNSLKVSICPANVTAFNAWAYKTSFKSVPTTSAYANTRGGTLDEMHIVVVDVTGDISGTPDTVLERFSFVSQASNALGTDGETIYYKSVINNKSNYIYWLDHPNTLSDAGELANGNTFTVVTSAITNTLGGGVNTDTVTVGEYQTAYTKLIDDKLNRADIVVAPRLPNGEDGVTLANFLIAKAEVKKDFILCLSPPIEDTLNVDKVTAKANVVEFYNALTPSKFATGDSSSVKVFDKYNGGVNVTIPGSGNLASTFAYTYRFADVASSNAGTKRGQYSNLVDLNYDPTDADQGALIDARCNPVVSVIGKGIYLNGDKTLLERESAFDQTAVVSTFITLNRAITDYAENYLFEKNDALTDLLFRQDIDAFLKDQVQKRIISVGRISKGVTSDPNEYVGNIYIVPINSIRYITLNFIAVKGQGVNLTINEGKV
jgi:hypothetical protein